jgi:pimeloyl-ACP methyl ester carboxylesterase
VRAAIALAGIPDLVEAQRIGLGGGAVAALMGGTPREHPARYSSGSPAALLPLGVPQYLVHGLRDTTVPASLSETYAARARHGGDDAVFVPVPGASHLDMIRRRGAAAAQLAQLLARLDPT